MRHGRVVVWAGLGWGGVGWGVEAVGGAVGLNCVCGIFGARECVYNM